MFKLKKKKVVDLLSVLCSFLFILLISTPDILFFFFFLNHRSAAPDILYKQKELDSKFLIYKYAVVILYQ